MVYWHLPRGRLGFGENTYVAWRIPPFGGEPQCASTVLFWLVPILFPFEWIPQKYIPLYEVDPVAAQVMSLRRIFWAGHSPIGATLAKLAGVSIGFFCLACWFFAG
jgi:ABC-type polysaccharide/polyol phosphate export permease